MPSQLIVEIMWMAVFCAAIGWLVGYLMGRLWR
jgi:hypothetical protein